MLIFLAGMMYALAAQISLSTDGMLWWAIVGLTDQFLQQKIGYARYEQDYDHFKQEVMERANEREDQNNNTPVSLFYFLFLFSSFLPLLPSPPYFLV